jgi:DNA-directed RNA polymerase subunit E'/Rpb7
MSSPYINAYLNTTVRIQPNQMDNNIRKHIKNSIEREHLNKCFLDYGYLNKIHEIYPDYDAEIIAEDPMACALFKVRMSCTLCRPILNSTIICKAMGITPPIIYLVNGPLDIIVKTSQNINKNVFVFNQRLNRWTVSKNNVSNVSNETETESKKKYLLLEEGVYLKVKIINKKIIDKSDRILCTGYLEDIATENEIKDSMNIVNSIEKYSSMKEYLDIENKREKEEEKERMNRKTVSSELSELSEETETEETDTE